MAENLNLKYRPAEFEDVSSQKSLIKILQQQLLTDSIKNCYLFEGSSGTGKTTVARIFAKKINKGLGSPIEIDAASNNGVDNVRTIIDGAIERSLDSEYKVYIVDEAHMISIAGWNAFLKCIEEPPKYTIFIFCTTDPQKIPQTIINRCQVFRLNRIDDEAIVKRLQYICSKEQFTYDVKALEYISMLSEGSMRQAIAYLDKCKDYSSNITMENCIDCLGNYSYSVYFDLTNAVLDNNPGIIINTIDTLFKEGNDLKLFINNYIEFILQLTKYCIFKSMQGVRIPSSLEEKVKYTTGIKDNYKWYSKYLEKLMKLKQMLKNDTDMKTTIEVMLLNREGL